MNESHSEEVIAQLEQLNSEAGALISPCRYRTSYDLYGKLRLKAKQEEHLYFYALGTFYQMDQAQYLLEFSTMRERAIELISLLESEEQARKIQADVPLPIFEHLVHSMSACAYENLAEATGQLDGYNSEGLQACIADGIQVCRQTGKLPCIGCFREYSCDVYMSADDAEIARHQCSLVLDQSLPPSDRGDRRWLAKKKVAWMSCLEGRVDEALELIDESLSLTDGDKVSLKLESKLRASFDRDTYLILTGQKAELPNSPMAAEMPSPGECPIFDLQRDWNEALQATVDGEYPRAEEILTKWDRELSQRAANHLWFETRLRLVAVKQLAGNVEHADRLAKQLEKRANESTDWLTLRRLSAILDPDSPTSPLGIYGRIKTKCERAKDEVSGEEPLSDAASAGAEDEERGGPLKAQIFELGDELMKIEQETAAEQMEEIRAKIMAFTSDQIVHPDDASALMNIMGYVLGDCHDAEQVWAWANQAAGKFQDDGTVLSLLGQLGNQLRFSENQEFGQTITADRLEPLFRKSLQLHNTRPRSFMRAGDHFRAEGNQGEAERCYARAFRLERSEGEIALRLADLYRETDRLRDALHVLDVCLREGSEHPSVPWEAALAAFAVSRYEAMLTYLERFEQDSGNRPWLNYYRCIGYLEQGDAGKALSAIEAESELVEEPMLHIIALRACANAALGKHEDAAIGMRQVLEVQLASVDYLTPRGIGDLLQRCFPAANLVNETLGQEVYTRLLQTGMTDDDSFEGVRSGEPKEVSLYRCLVEQPLDDDWPNHPACQADQTHWPFYLAEWGVLAEDEDEAEKIALHWQQQCYPPEAPSLSQIMPSDQTYMDSSGVVWQGGRFCPLDFEGEDEESEL